MLKKVALAAAASAALFSNAALAGSASGTLNVTATITAACTFGTNSPIAFGSVLTTSSVTNNAGSLDITCTNLLPYTVSVDDGQNHDATAVLPSHGRRMKDSSGNFLMYEVYTNTGRTSIADSVAANNTFDTPGFGAGTGTNQAITIYGQIPVQTTPGAASFSDQLSLTVNF